MYYNMKGISMEGKMLVIRVRMRYNRENYKLYRLDSLEDNSEFDNEFNRYDEDDAECD